MDQADGKKKKKRHLQTSGGRGYRDGHFIRQRTRNWMKSLIFAPASPCRYEAGMARGCKAVQRTSSNFFGEQIALESFSTQDAELSRLPALATSCATSQTTALTVESWCSSPGFFVPW